MEIVFCGIHTKRMTSHWPKLKPTAKTDFKKVLLLLILFLLKYILINYFISLHACMDFRWISYYFYFVFSYNLIIFIAQIKDQNFRMRRESQILFFKRFIQDRKRIFFIQVKVIYFFFKFWILKIIIVFDTGLFFSFFAFM